MEKFDYFKFKKEINGGDLSGLEYLEKTLIEEYKEKQKQDKGYFYTKEDYLVALFYAVKHLNYCNDIYEHNGSEIAKRFDYNMYFQLRDLLLEELDLVSLWD